LKRRLLGFEFYCLAITAEYFKFSSLVVPPLMTHIPLPEGRRRKTKNATDFSPQANYTDCATAAAGDILPAFADRCCVVRAAELFGN
jgi:hypothetical protein